MKKFLSVLVLMVLVTIAIPADAQVSASQTWGVPAQPFPGNGQIRHLNNGYVGVNPRHYSRIPMQPGTGPIMATGPIVVYRPGQPCWGGTCMPRQSWPTHPPVQCWGNSCRPIVAPVQPCWGNNCWGNTCWGPTGPRGFVNVGVSGPNGSVNGVWRW